MVRKHHEPDNRRSRGDDESSGDITAGPREIRAKLSYVIGLGITIAMVGGAAIFNSGRAVQSSEDGREVHAKEITELKAAQAADRAVMNALLVRVAVIESILTQGSRSQPASALGMHLPLYVHPVVPPRDNTTTVVRMPIVVEVQSSH